MAKKFSIPVVSAMLAKAEMAAPVAEIIQLFRLEGPKDRVKPFI